LDFPTSFVSGFSGTTTMVRAEVVVVVGTYLVGAAMGPAVGVVVGTRLRAAAGALA
jgi:hypothetical protein